MANVYIKTVDGGEDTTPAGTDAIETDNGTTSNWVLLSNLYKAIGSGTQNATTFLNGAGAYAAPGGVWGSVSGTLSDQTDLQAVLSSGWIPVADTLTYASPSTVNVPTGAASRYEIGMKFRFKQGGGYKYFTIAAVADTLLTFIVNTTHTVANAAITDVYYSPLDAPFGFPQWFALAAPTYTVAELDNGSGGQPTTAEFRYRTSGRQIACHIKGNGTKAGAGFIWTLSAGALPVAPLNTSDRTIMGSAASEGGYNGVVRLDSTATTVVIVHHASIADNEVIDFWGATYSYEF